MIFTLKKKKKKTLFKIITELQKMLQEGGPLPGPKTGLLFNTQK